MRGSQRRRTRSVETILNGRLPKKMAIAASDNSQAAADGATKSPRMIGSSVKPQPPCSVGRAIERNVTLRCDALVWLSEFVDIGAIVLWCTVRHAVGPFGHSYAPRRVYRITRGVVMAQDNRDIATTGRPSVLFLCVHNAGRSQMAAGWLRHLGKGRVDVFSGGSNPGTALNAVAVAAMDEMGIDIATETPRSWTDAIVRAADVVVTMGCGDTCPVFPGKRYEDWELTDPAGQPIEVVRRVRDEIRDRVEALLISLDL